MIIESILLVKIEIYDEQIEKFTNDQITRQTEEGTDRQTDRME